MSQAEIDEGADPGRTSVQPSPVPGVFEVAWLLLMQPIQFIKRAREWGLDLERSLWRQRSNLCRPVVQALLRRLAVLLFLVMPVSATGLCAALNVCGVEIAWKGVAFGVAFGVVSGVAFGVGHGEAFGVAFGVVFGVASGVAFGVGLGEAFGVKLGVVFSVALSIAYGIAWGIALGVAHFPTGVATGVAVAVATGVATGVAFDVKIGIVFGVAFGLAYLRLPLLVFESLTAWILATAVRGRLASRKVWLRHLPYRSHDLIFFPLPGLRRLIIDIGDTDPKLAEELIAEAAGTIGQKTPARLALIELQASTLERAASRRTFSAVADMALPFLPAIEADPALSALRGMAADLSASPPEGATSRREFVPVPSFLGLRVFREVLKASTLERAASRRAVVPAPSFFGFRVFREVAIDLRAAQASRSHSHRGKCLQDAENKIKRLQNTLIGRRRPAPLEKRLLVTARAWQDVITDERAALERDKRERPQVPLPFVAGPSLTASDQGLFRGRRDLVDLIDHYLSGTRRTPVVLFGQRRMGKSSFLNMLPLQLGAGTVLVSLNCQRLSVNPRKGEPVFWVLDQIAKVVEGLPPAPRDLSTDILIWLETVDHRLAEEGRKILVAMDEVESMEEGLRHGWLPSAGLSQALDMIRAVGDSLQHIQFLLATAWRFDRLDPIWSRHLISPVIREITYLDSLEARRLLLEPEPGFPAIYPEGGVDRILYATHGHPYLLQLAGDLLCQRINAQGRLSASDADVTHALDKCIDATPLFQELWNMRAESERSVLRSLAYGTALPPASRTSLNHLKADGFVECDGDSWQVAVRLFATWIRERAPESGEAPAREETSLE